MNPPRISVVIPVYNAEKTIQETIQSVLDQTFQDFEIIVVNDGSFDGSMEVVSQIKDPRIRIFSQANKGAAAARNKGFSVSRGERIAFLDADDLWEPEKLKAESNSLDQHPEANIAYCWVDAFDRTKEVRYVVVHPQNQGNILRYLLVEDIIQGGSNALIRRGAFEAVGGFDESLKSGECWDIHIRLAKYFQYTLVSKPYVLYRISLISKSFKVRQMEKMCTRILNKAYQDAPDDLKRFKSLAISKLYKYLEYKSLMLPGRKSCLIAGYFLLRRNANTLIWCYRNRKFPKLIHLRRTIKNYLHILKVFLTR